MSKKKLTVIETFKPVFDRIDCSAGLIFIDTPEETRVIREILKKYPDDVVNFWSIGQGLHEIDRNKINVNRFFPHKFPSAQARLGSGGKFDTRQNPAYAFAVIEEDCRGKTVTDVNNEKRNIYVLRDLDKFFKDPVILRKLKDLVYLASTANSTIVITGYGITVPTEIEKDTVFIKLNYPTYDEILLLLKDTNNQIADHNKKYNASDKINPEYVEDDIARACCGLTEDQIINTLQYSMVTLKKIDVASIIEEKKSIINKSDILEFWNSTDDLNQVGGFNNIKNWISTQKTVIQNADNAIKFKTEPPKAIMLIGVEGSGKTLIAKAIAHELKTSLIKFDIGKVFGSLMGESEKRARQGLTLADAVGGVVVIDEIDKALSGAGSSDKTDGGTTNRVIGTFLNWLNEEHPGMLLIATANDISTIRANHPALLRKGRFDEIWFSDVPNSEERKEIFKIHISKRERDPSKFDINKLASYEYEDLDGTKFVITGAEIESSIKDALRNKFALGKGKEIEIGGKDDITTDDILETLRKIKPITKVGKEKISSMRKWSEDNANNVSSGIIKPKETKQKKTKVNLRTDDIVI
ncbi:MAG: AAA family ATPase [Candidatus Omnitrophica bacterium]|jgi:SpoVK/Ycf46/Vps4 family AAA+-type ATPase|nr:AAA family ATPase [Candidatus Omnitrophota bacterium]